jgi:CheY-like chemotaxis protein
LPWTVPGGGAVRRLAEGHFDQIIVDFDDPEAASQVLGANRHQADSKQTNPAVTVALLQDASKIREILGAGAHFILVKPINYDQAQATLRAATALLKRERRQAFRVAVQAPISLRMAEAQNIEGILLDVSSGGIDVLAAKPLPSGSLAHFSFELPGNVQVEGDGEVAWSSINGQTGLRFLDIDVRMRDELNDWLANHSQDALPEEPDPVSHCKLPDLSL